MIVQIKEDRKPQCWYEEEEDGYRVCIRKLKSDYFRTEFIKCMSKDAAIDLVQRIKDNGYTNIPITEIKPDTSNCTEQENNVNVEKYEDIAIESVIEEDKPKAKFEFNCDDDLKQQYSKIPRYEEIPEGRVHKTGVSKLIRYGSVQKRKGFL